MSGTSIDDPSARPGGDFAVVVMAASAGGGPALGAILAALPIDFRAAIAAVQHRMPGCPGQLAQILDRRSPLAVKDAVDGDRLCPGIVHLAPAARHLLVNHDGSLTLSRSEKVHRVRPAAENLFETAAVHFKSRVIAVVLTGADGDGSSGIRSVKRMGGHVIAQDEQTSEVFGMPRTAIRTGVVDLILPLTHIAPALVALVMK